MLGVQAWACNLLSYLDVLCQSTMANVLLTICTAKMLANEGGSAEVHSVCSDWSVDTFQVSTYYTYGVRYSLGVCVVYRSCFEQLFRQTV